MFHALYFRRSLLLETKTEYLYHGSDWPNQKVLEPRKSGFEKDYVFATDNLIEAVIFLSKKRNSLQATWDVNCEVPFFCERAEGVFEKWYKRMIGSVYVLPKGDFGKVKGLSKNEFVSSKAVGVLREIEIPDAKEYLESKIRIVMFKNRREVFPTDEDLVRMCMRGLEKYTLDYTLRRIRKLNPGLESEFLLALEKSKG